MGCNLAVTMVLVFLSKTLYCNCLRHKNLQVNDYKNLLGKD